jgi:outer membrane protein TolC
MINEAMQDLVNLLNTKSKKNILISDSLVIDRTLSLDSTINWLTRNPSYLSAEQQIKINEQVAKEVAAQRYPSLKLNTAYNFSRTDNSVSYTQYSQFTGPSAGLTLQVPIFNSNIYRTQKRVANLNISNAKLQKENLLNSLTNIATKKYLTYTTLLQQIESQQANTELAKNLVDLVLTNFQNGQATILDVKAAQSSYENSAFQLINYMYEAKVAEIQLKQLIYQLSY